METIHTTANHPWLTADRGWVAAGSLQPGKAVVTLNGGSSGSGGTVAWVHVVSGQADMYNLTVTHDHTYAVGDGQWVVNNVGCNDLINEAEQTAQGANKISATAISVEDATGSSVTLDPSVFTSGQVSPYAAGPFQDIVDHAKTSGGAVARYAGECGEVAACLALVDNGEAVKGGYVDMGLFHEGGIGPCSTCQKKLQRTANLLSARIHLEAWGVEDPFDFEPEP